MGCRPACLSAAALVDVNIIHSVDQSPAGPAIVIIGKTAPLTGFALNQNPMTILLQLTNSLWSKGDALLLNFYLTCKADYHEIPPFISLILLKTVFISVQFWQFLFCLLHYSCTCVYSMSLLLYEILIICSLYK